MDAEEEYVLYRNKRRYELDPDGEKQRRPPTPDLPSFSFSSPFSFHTRLRT